jgi:TBC1 domain family member 10
MPNHSPTLNVMPTPAIPRPPSEMVPEPGVSPSRTSLFLPHPNAPKPSATPQGPLYGRTTSAVPPPPANLLIQMLQKAAQIHTGPNGLPRFNTIYAMTPQDLSMSPGPVPVYFSVNPPKDVPANRMRIVTPTAQSSPPRIPVNLRPPAEGQALTPTSTVAAQTGISPNAAAARRRSRSFSGFDSSMTPGVPPKEQRLVVHSPIYP